MKTCKICLESKPLTEFYSNGFQPNGKAKHKPNCSTCENRRRLTNHYTKLKSILEELGQKVECALCGYNKNWSSLCFHHLDDDTKEFEINKAKTASKERVKTEIEKCVLLCHNCHMEVHYPQNQIVDDDN